LLEILYLLNSIAGDTMQYPIKKIGSLMKKLLIFFCAVLISCSFNQQIMVLNTKISDRYFDLLEKTGVEYSQTDAYLYFKKNASNVHAISRALKIMDLELQVIHGNISNSDTTDNGEGKPYVRQIVQVLGDGSAQIVSDVNSSTHLIYDPTHPNAIKTGEKTGYVHFPNINLVEEMTYLVSASQMYELLSQILIEMDPGIIIPGFKKSVQSSEQSSPLK
jgi:flagellar basal body rod protein FlgC